MDRWLEVASALLAFLLYYNTLDNGFVYDDRRAILSNPDVIGHTSIKALFENDFWGTPVTDPGSHGSYRPLCVATYRLNYAFSGFKPWSYHLLNVILHCTATALVVVTARRILPSYCLKVGTAITGLTFAAHPIHTESVAGVVGRADLAACNLFLLSFLIYHDHIKLRERSHWKTVRTVKTLTSPHVSSNDYSRVCCHEIVQHILFNIRRLVKVGSEGSIEKLNSCEVTPGVRTKLSGSDSECNRNRVLEWATLVGTLCFGVAATLCKEPAIMVLPLCMLYDLLKAARREETLSMRRWRSICFLAIGGCALLYWRISLTGVTTTFATADNPTSKDPSFLTRIYTFSYLPVFNFLLLLYPLHLSFDWSMDSVPRITHILDYRNILTIIFYTLLSKVTWNALVKEFNRRQDIHKENKQKRYNAKVKHKWAFCKNFKRGHDCFERRSYVHERSFKEAGTRKKVCSCVGCKHVLTEEHTMACRAYNNNNAMTHHSNCVCPKYNTRSSQKPIYRSPYTALLMCVAFMVLPFVPATNIVFYVGFVVAERVLYIPSVGFCLMLGLGAGTLNRHYYKSEKQSRLFMLALLITLTAMCGHTMRRNIDWRDEESLFKSALHINPPKAYANLGSVLTAQGRTDEAEVAFERALRYRPNMADVHYNLGILLQNQRRFGKAIKSFERAIYFRPSMALAYVNLGTSLMADGRVAEAASALRAGSQALGERVRDRREHDAARVSALVQLAGLHSRKGHFLKAISAYKEALLILPETNVPIVGWTRHNILSMAGELYMQLQQWSQAELSILSALAVAPHHVGTHLALAQILARNMSRSLEAEVWFKKAVTLAPDDPSVRDQFGMFLRSQRRLRESAEQLVAAARLSPTDSARAASAARALRDARRCRSAEKWYARAVQLSPQDAEYHSNLGAILHLNGKYEDAASSYRQALLLQPNDEITITNLKRVRALISKERRK